MTDQEFAELKDHANNWRFLGILASRGLNKAQTIAHGRKTTRGDLDAWLMSQFNLTPIEAREISNYSMENIDYRIGSEGVRWTARRPAPTLEDYPELVEYFRCST